MAKSLLSVLVLTSGLWAGPFRPKQKVILKVPSSYEKWVLSDTCTIAWLLATNEKYKEGIGEKIKADKVVVYVPNTQAVIQELDEDGYCGYVETVPDGSTGWVYSGLMELTTAERKLAAMETKAAAERREAERRRLEALPRLVGPTGNVIVAVDEGCLRDTQKLKGLSGLELRKKAAELAGYGCVFTVPSGTHVEAKKLNDGAYAVVMQDGPAKGRSGVVSADFVQR